jgi:hypothetical protein
MDREHRLPRRPALEAEHSARGGPETEIVHPARIVAHVGRFFQDAARLSAYTLAQAGNCDSHLRPYASQSCGQEP